MSPLIFLVLAFLLRFHRTIEHVYKYLMMVTATETETLFRIKFIPYAMNRVELIVLYLVIFYSLLFLTVFVYCRLTFLSYYHSEKHFHFYAHRNGDFRICCHCSNNTKWIIFARARTPIVSSFAIILFMTPTKFVSHSFDAKAVNTFIHRIWREREIFVTHQILLLFSST